MKLNKKLTMPKKKMNLDKNKIFTIASASFLVIAHILILVAIIMAWRYFSIYPSLFGSAVAIIICSLIIIDIIFFVGFNHHDLFLKIVSSLMAILLLVGGTFGSSYISKANSIVNNVLDDGKSDKYETYSGVFVCDGTFNKFSSLADLSGKKVGMLVETTDGLSYIATNILSKEKIDYATVDYQSNSELIQALIDKQVDAIVITSAYKTIFGYKEGVADEEQSPFAKSIEQFKDFYTFEQELKVDSNRSKKNLSKEPFNVLLIGYSRTDIGSTVGLADSIILATINPQTYSVSMMSIARDSFVPISCYGGSLDKINSGRSTSKACFIETVENFIGMEVDYYMELDYLGLVAIVDAIGGITITNPVEFDLDGIHVPAGTFLADGQQALQFSRERHHMPGGDFDRQQHQKEVIIQIAKKFIESGSVSLALKAMEDAEDYMSTDFTLSQLTGLFNLLLNTKNYTSLNTFDLLDFQTLRITGLGGIMYYSMSMRLPLWVYLIYQGSYNESMQHVNNVMGQYKTITQDYNFEFTSKSKYVRPELYSTEYENKFVYEPDPMPPYWASLDGMTLTEAMAWASSNGITLNVEYINAGDPGYDASQEGFVVAQSPRYGALVSEYKSGSVTVMGTGEVDEDMLVPNMSGWKASEAKSWANDNGVTWDSGNPSSGRVTYQSCKAKSMITACKVLSIDAEELVSISVESDDTNYGTVSGGGTVKKGSSITIKATPKNGFKFVKWSDDNTSAERTIKAEEDKTYIAYFEINHTHNYQDAGTASEATCTANKVVKKKCSICGNEITEEVEGTALGHSWPGSGTVVSATCTEGGYTLYKCTRCGETKQENVTSALGHAYEIIESVDASCENGDGHITYKCSRCQDTYTETISPTGCTPENPPETPPENPPENPPEQQP